MLSTCAILVLMTKSNEMGSIMLKVQVLEILEKLFALGGNHDTARLLELRNEFLNFLRREEQLFMSRDDESIVIAKDSIRFIDALNAYATTSSIIEASNHVQIFFERLANSEKWNYYEINLLIGSLGYTKDIKQTLTLANKAIEVLMDYTADTRSKYLSGSIAFNTISRILYTKFFDDELGIDLEKELNQWLLKLKLQVLNENKLKIPYEVAQIKQAVFNKDRILIIERMNDFEKKYDENIFKVVSREIDSYIISDRYSPFFSNKKII